MLPAPRTALARRSRVLDPRRKTRFQCQALAERREVWQHLVDEQLIGLRDEGGVGVQRARDHHYPLDSERGDLCQTVPDLLGWSDEREAVDELVLERAACGAAPWPWRDSS